MQQICQRYLKYYLKVQTTTNLFSLDGVDVPDVDFSLPASFTTAAAVAAPLPFGWALETHNAQIEELINHSPHIQSSSIKIHTFTSCSNVEIYSFAPISKMNGNRQNTYRFFA